MWIIGIVLYLALGLIVFPLAKRYPGKFGPSRELIGFGVGSSIDPEPFLLGLLIWVFWPLVIVFGLFLACNTLESPIKKSSDSESSQLIGFEGVTVTDLKPSGKVEVDGKPYNATSVNKFIPKGHSVRIVNRQGMSFVVEELANQAD